MSDREQAAASCDTSGVTLFVEATQARVRGDLSAALRLGRRALSALERETGPGVASRRRGFAAARRDGDRDLGRPAEAQTRLERAVALAGRLPPDGELLLLRLRARAALAGARRLAGRYEEAETLYRCGIAEAERLPGRDDAVLVELLNGLGVSASSTAAASTRQGKTPTGGPLPSLRAMP